MRRVTCSTALALVAALTGVVLTAPAGHAAEGTYVAFGDSFTSGPGIAPQKPDGCARSERNFPTVLAAELGYTGDAFVDASCGGATTDDLFDPQTRNGTVIAPAQLDALSEDTTLVTFGTIGGNDIGLVGLASRCFVTDCVGTGPSDQDFDDLEVALNDGIDQTQLRAPDAQVVIIGYSTYLPPGGCVATFGGALTVEEFAYVQSQIDRLSDLLEKVAGAQGVDFVDMREIPFSLEHTACAAPEKQWIRALSTYDDGAPLHPSRCGMDAMFQHLHRELVGPGAPDFDNTCVSAGPAPTPPTNPAPTNPAPTTDPTTAPQPDAAAAVRRELLAQAAGLRLTTSCRPGRAGRRVVLRVKGRAPDAAVARFSVGSRKVGVDRSAPLRATRPVGTRPWRGKAVAKVKLQRGEVSVWHRIERKRPRCLR